MNQVALLPGTKAKTSISVGIEYFSCVIDDNDDVQCWGEYLGWSTSGGSDGPNPNTFKIKFKKFKVYFWLGFLFFWSF